MLSVTKNGCCQTQDIKAHCKVRFPLFSSDNNFMSEPTQRLQAALLIKAPVLQPRIIPRGYDDQCLQVFCHTAERTTELQKITKELTEKSSRCGACESLNKKASHLTTFWETDEEERTHNLRSIKVRHIFIDLPFSN